MEKKMNGDLLKRLLAVALALTVAVTFIPLLGDIAYAEDEGEPAVEVEVPDVDATDPAGITTEDPTDITVEEPTVPEDPTDVTVEEPSEGDGINTEETVPAEIETAAPEIDEEALAESVHLLSLDDSMVAAKETLDDVFSVSIKRSGASILINAYIKYPYTNNGCFRTISIDNSIVRNINTTSLKNYKIGVAGLSPGYHTVTLGVFTKNEGEHLSDIDPSRTCRVGILYAPAARTGLEFYHNRIAYGMTMDGNLVNYKLFIEYSTNGKNWKTYGPISYYDSGSIYGLLANTNYRVRSYYGVQRSGKWFTGKEEGKFRYLGNYKTGVADKVQVKSIKVKAYKVKKKKQKVYGYYTGLYLGKRTYYKYKLKIIVKLKKKPGTAGIWINGKKYKGNKKKYVVKLGTMTSYYKPKGKKYTVAIYKYHNASWGGYSPMYVKTKKIK